MLYYTCKESRTFQGESDACRAGGKGNRDLFLGVRRSKEGVLFRLQDQDESASRRKKYEGLLPLGGDPGVHDK